MLPATLPTDLTPTDIVCQNIDDVGFLTELFFKCRQLRIDLLVLGSPLVLVFFLQVLVGGVELRSE
jgi:hypothetical protein